MDLLNYVRNQWDRVAAWAFVVAGALALLIGWLGISRTAYPAEQNPYIISGGLAGIFLLGLGGVLWLSADLRDEWRKLDRLESVGIEMLRRAGEPDAEAAATSRAYDATLSAPVEPAPVDRGNGTRRRRASPQRRA